VTLYAHATISSCGDRGTVGAMGLPGGASVCSWTLHAATPQVSWCPRRSRVEERRDDGKTLASGSRGLTIKLWDVSPLK
jgi:hypothetical protein